MDLSPAHLHLMVNHIPVLGPWFIALVLIFGLVHRSGDILKLGLVLAVLFAAATGGVFLTGEPAEHQLEEETWFDDDIAHEHEERAQAGLVASLATGAVALVGLVRSRGGRTVGRPTGAVVLLAIMACGGLFAWTALEGGEIRHDEIRHERGVEV